MTTIKKVLLCVLEYQNNLKLHHFQTANYSVHKSTDSLYESLTNLMDEFFEVWQGKTHKLTPLKGSIKLKTMKDKDFINYTKKFIVYLKHAMKKSCELKENTDLCNILDEIIASLSKFIYLSTFK